jgi:MFS family permease
LGVAASQIATSIAGAAIVPAVTGITLGIVKQKGFNRQNGRNQAFNHAGNMVGAAVSGYLGWRYGYTAVFLLAALFGVISVAFVLMIPGNAIDNRAARGKEEDPESQPSGFDVLVKHKPLLILALALAAFHLGNAAIIPLYGLAAVGDGHANGPTFVATAIVVAQAVMIVTSIVGMRAAESRNTRDGGPLAQRHRPDQSRARSGHHRSGRRRLTEPGRRRLDRRMDRL